MPEAELDGHSGRHDILMARNDGNRTDLELADRRCGGGSWLQSLRDDRLGRQGQVQNELTVAQVKAYRSVRVRTACELAWPEIPVRSGAVADPDLPDAGSLLG